MSLIYVLQYTIPVKDNFLTCFIFNMNFYTYIYVFFLFKKISLKLLYAITFSSRALLQSSITVISTYQFCFFRHFHWWHSRSHDAKLYPDYTYECIFMEIFCSLFLPGVIPGPGKFFFDSLSHWLQHSVRYVTPHVPILFSGFASFVSEFT